MTETLYHYIMKPTREGPMTIRLDGQVASGGEPLDHTLLINPMAIDRALTQTARFHEFAEIPEPSYAIWKRWAQYELQACVFEERPCDVRFKWFHYCLNIDFTQADDGDIHLCLLPHEHEGCCR